MEANEWVRKNPVQAAGNIQSWTKVDKEVAYIFLGPGGIDTLDPTIKPRWIEALKTDYGVLKKLNTVKDLDIDKWVNDSFVREAFKESGRNYDAQLASFANYQVQGMDTVCNTAVSNPSQAGQIWVQGGDIVPFSSATCTLEGVNQYHAQGRKLDAVYAATPFNFTAIGGNLATAPAIMGNTVIWKPAVTASLSNYLFLELLEEAGLPPGVINFVPAAPASVSSALLTHPDFAGLHFTGSTAVFDSLWLESARNLSTYKSYPRLVGETGGKDFVLAHASASAPELATALLRGAFEYQGQKCSAASRAYVPASLWREVKSQLLSQVETIRMGDIADFNNFMGAVIDRRAFERIKTYIDQAKASSDANLVCGGTCDDSIGYFVEPTIIEVTDPSYVTMREEIFGPVLSAYVYDDAKCADVLTLVDSTSGYGLTGSIFARDRKAIHEASTALRYVAGNFYVNDKPTGAVVGQQPFGGARRSGTNDKAGSHLNLLRWTSPRTIKETSVPASNYEYPYMS